MLLKEEEFVPFAPDEVNKEVRVRHCHPYKEKLYIRRCENGDIVAYCHHCSTGGFKRATYEKALTSRVDARHTGEAGHKKRDTDRDNVPYSYAEWMDRGTNFSTGTNKERNRTGIGWFYQFRVSPGQLTGTEPLDELCARWYDDRWWIPLFSAGLKVVRAQGRDTLNKTDSKWLTEVYADKIPWLPFDAYILASYHPETIVLTEDIVSAYRVSRCGFTALPLLGTHLPDYLLTSVIGYDKIVVWLDNDNPTVRYCAVKIRQKVDLLSNNVTIVDGVKDPKHLTDADIIDIVTYS